MIDALSFLPEADVELLEAWNGCRILRAQAPVKRIKPASTSMSRRSALTAFTAYTSISPHQKVAGQGIHGNVCA